MGQAANPKRITETEARAFAKSMAVTPRKLGLVAGLIRGKTAAAALNALTFSRRRIAGDVKKLLQSAIANAENNHRLNIDRLVVAEASVGKAFVIKRFSARGRGKSSGIQTFFSNMTIILREAGTPGSADAKTKNPTAKATAKAAKETATADKPTAKKKTSGGVKAPSDKVVTKKPAAKKTAAKKETA